MTKKYIESKCIKSLKRVSYDLGVIKHKLNDIESLLSHDIEYHKNNYSDNYKKYGEHF